MFTSSLSKTLKISIRNFGLKLIIMSEPSLTIGILSSIEPINVLIDNSISVSLIVKNTGFLSPSFIKRVALSIQLAISFLLIVILVL